MVVPKYKLVTVAAAGTAVSVLGASDTQGTVIGVSVQAHTGTIYVGDEDVDASAGIKLDATTAAVYNLPLDGQPIDLKKVYIDGGTNGDKAIVVYFEKVGR